VTTESTYFVTANVFEKRSLFQVKDYIWQNPVKRHLPASPEQYPYTSAHPAFKSSLDLIPQRLKPISSAALPQA
jgi:hypothetical protein